MNREPWQSYGDAEFLRLVKVRLIRPAEKRRWDRLMQQRHYLKNACLVGEQLRYVAQVGRRWVALLGWSAASYQLRWREARIGWSLEERLRRRKFLAQNSRFLVLANRGRYPNLASRVLGLCAQRLSADWEAAYGHGLLGVETFVDPQRFRGTCYRATGWERLGTTRGYRRIYRDFYQEDGEPKELWVKPLQEQSWEWLGSERMPSPWAEQEDRVLHCGYHGEKLESLWEHFRRVSDHRGAKGRRHRLANVLAICALATLCGCRGPRAIADFATYLDKTQRRLLRCWWNEKTQAYDVPSEPTIRRILRSVSAEEVERELFAWMQSHDPSALEQVAVDGKAIKGARAADGRPVHLVSAISTSSRRMLAQRPVSDHSNEIPALEPMLRPVALDGVIVSTDAMHAQQDAARFLEQDKGAPYFFTLKGNQSGVLERVQHQLDSAFSPSGSPTGP